MSLNKQVLEVLTNEVQEQMTKHGLTWDTIQAIDIKAKFGYPMAVGTLYKLIRQPKYYSEKQSKALLNYFGIGFSVFDGVIVLN